MSNELLLESILKNDIEYVVSVPCQEFSDLLTLIQAEHGIITIRPQREDEGIGILLGLAMSGKRCMGIFQDTLLGNSQNIMGFVTSSCRVGLCLWLGSRKDEFLKRNIVHEYITNNVPHFCHDGNVNLQNMHFSDLENIEQMSGAMEKVSGSFTPGNQTISVLQMVF